MKGYVSGWYGVVSGGCPGGVFGPLDGTLAFGVGDYGVSGFGHVTSSIEIGIEFNYI